MKKIIIDSGDNSQLLFPTLFPTSDPQMQVTIHGMTADDVWQRLANLTDRTELNVNSLFILIDLVIQLRALLKKGEIPSAFKEAAQDNDGPRTWTEQEIRDVAQDVLVRRYRE